LVRSRQSQHSYQPRLRCNAAKSFHAESANVNASLRLLVLATLALLILSGTASAADALTCRFTGTVRLDNARVPDGTIVAAIIGDEVYSTVTPTGYGDSTYAIEIDPEDGAQYPEGTKVVFRVDGCDADQTGFVKAGENIRMDLTAWSTPQTSASPLASVTPPPSPVPTPLSDSDVWPTAGLAITCVLELFVVGGVVYLTVKDWNR
jgi:hypothetical protein